MSDVAAVIPDLDDRRSRLKYKMAEAREELIAVLRSLTPEQMGYPTHNEGWTVGHVAAHIASAEGGMEPIARRILSREPNQREAAAGFDLSRYNEGRIKKRMAKSIDELIEELEASRKVSLEILDQASDEDLNAEGYHPFAGDINLYGLFVVIYRHERDHAADIRQAIADHKK